VDTNAKQKKSLSGFFKIFSPYKWIGFLLVMMTLGINIINLFIPKVISKAIDTFARGQFDSNTTIINFGILVILAFLIGVGQTILQTKLSESIGRDLRDKVTDKVSRFTYRQIMEQTPSKLLTNFTSDVNSVRQFIAQGMLMLLSSIILIIGSAILLFTINVKLTFIVLGILPLIVVAFFVIFKNIGDVFTKAQEVTDGLNKVISENIFGSALIRVLNSQYEEAAKFKSQNEKSKDIGLAILKMFAALIPIITTVANLCVLAVAFFGGRSVLGGSMTVGDFVSFYSYIALLIFPIIVLGFIGSEFGRAVASYQRIEEVLEVKEEKEEGIIDRELTGNIDFNNISLSINNQSILKDISFKIKAGKKTALLGPTAAGKTQIFYLLANLIKQDSGEVLYDGINGADLDKDSFFRQIGLVFQDSVIFNTSVRENIAFRDDIKPEALKKAIQTAELEAFIDALPQGLDTIISERGTSLSGGQKQRLTLARALAHEPKILLLDDFTARLDNETERKIFENIDRNYPNITKILITQKISSILDADNVILLMEGELLGTGTHEELMKSSFEYQQIAKSQQTTE
jgi:ATP-binding cassette subfamily B protein